MPKKSRKQAGSKFGERVGAARRSRGMTQAELADKTGVHISHVQRMEAGTTQPTLEVLKRMAGALQTSIDELVFDRASEIASGRLSDAELIEQLAAIENFPDRDKQAIKTILNAMILKQRVEAAVR